MKAIIMAGGKGTRLRPLTCKQPKPMAPIATKPMMTYIIGLLRQYQLTQIGATLFYLPELIRNYYGNGDEFGVSLRYFQEESPLGTAGSVRNAEAFLDETFLVISGDALTDINLEEAISFHRQKKALATIILTKVNHPLEYGVVITDQDGRVRRFLEKPGWGEVFSDTVNTGIYILEPEIFNYYQKDQVFDFSKDLFPKLLAANKPLYGFVASGYWSDVGNLEQYRQANYDLLTGRLKLKPPGKEILPGVWAGEKTEIDHLAKIEPPVVLGEYTCIKEGAVIGGYTVIGDYSLIQKGASIKKSVLWNHVYIGASTEIRGAVLSSRSHIKYGVSIYEGAVLGDGCIVNSRSIVKPGIKVWPDKYIESGTLLNESLIWGSCSGQNLFGNLGVDKTANIEMTPEFAAKLGAAYGTVLPERGRVAVGADTHQAAKMLKRAIIAGLLSSGVEVFDLGIMTTPVMRFAVTVLGAEAGILVRLSPTNPENILIEFLDEKGLNVDRGRQRQIEQAFFTEEFRRAGAEKVGEPAYLPHLILQYLKGILSSTDPGKIKGAHLKIVVNYDSGTLSLLLPTLLENLGCQTINLSLREENREGRSKTLNEILLALDEIGRRVRAEKADLGVVVDNNAERLILIDEKGSLVQDEQFAALISLLVLKYSQCSVVPVPVTAGRIIEELAKEFSGQVVRTKANPRSLMERVAEEKIFPDSEGKSHFQPAFDALFSLVKILELMAREGLNLSEIVSLLPLFYREQKSVACPWEEKGRVMRALYEEKKDQRVEMVDGLKVHYEDGWALVLPDAEDPVFQIYSEASSQEQAEALSEMYIKEICRLRDK